MEPSRRPCRWQEILASAYELDANEVAHDAAHVRHSVGSDEHLITTLEQRHGWTPDSELGPYFLAALRRDIA